MSRSTVNLVLDAALLFLIAAVISTGLILGFILPPGSGGGLGHGRGVAEALLLWGQTRHEWGTVHLWLALSLIGLVVIHLWLHWRWIWSIVTRPRPGLSPRRRRLRLTVAALIVLVVTAVIAIPWLAPVQRDLDVSGETVRSGRGGVRWAAE